MDGELKNKSQRNRSGKFLQFKFLVPLGAERVRLDGSRPDEFRRNGAAQRVPLLPAGAVLALEAQPETVMLPQLIVPRHV